MKTCKKNVEFKLRIAGMLSWSIEFAAFMAKFSLTSSHVSVKLGTRGGEALFDGIFSSLFY
jgi:hypothetical protein